jgi:DNA-binding CsgD family transcriptional regulator
LVPIVVRAQRSLRLAGVLRSAPRALDRSGLVTGREREVLDLVAQGLSNAEIGRRLGVGRPTVRRLLENARGKLGATDRVEAAARVLGR